MAINSAWSSMHPASWGTNVSRSVVPGVVASGFGDESLGKRDSVYGGLSMSSTSKGKTLGQSFGEARVGDAMSAAGKKAAMGFGLGALKTGALMGMVAPSKMNVGSIISGALSTMNPAATALGVMGSVLGAAVGVSNKKSTYAGAVLGGLLGGPLGAALGAPVGNFLSEAIQDITDIRESEQMRDTMEDAFGEISGRMATADLGQYATGALTNPQAFGIAQAPAALAFAESIRSQSETYAAPFAQNFGYGSPTASGESTYGGFSNIGGPMGGFGSSYGAPMGGWGGLGIGNPSTYGGNRSSGGEGFGSGGFSGLGGSETGIGGWGGSSENDTGDDGSPGASGGHGGGSGDGDSGGDSSGSGDSGGCFLAGTKILMATGEYVNIEDVEVGDHVMSYDVYLDRPVRGLVDRLGGLDNQFGYYIVTTADGGQLELTHDHPVYTTFGFKACCPSGPEDEVDMGDGDWEPVERLLPGDCIVDINGNSSEVIDIEYVNDEVKTYNLEIVLPYHTFVANGKVVHDRT